jgi:hypothetical protein
MNVPAVAGAGKSVVIVELARRLATSKILFLAQSRNVTDRARNTLPRNVTVKTIYEMAAQHVRLTHRDKLNGPGVLSSLTRERVKSVLADATSSEIDRAIYVLQQFYKAPGSFPELKHIPRPRSAAPDWRFDDKESMQAVAVARDIWFSQCRQDPDSLPLTFDAVIKLWTLSTPETVRLDEFNRTMTVTPLGDHDLVVLEEAQDSSEALLNFLARQPSSTIMFADPYQALTHGNLAIQQLRHPLQQRAETVFMGESWRFGPSLASVLNALTEKASHPTPQRITGMGLTNVYDTGQRLKWLSAGEHYTLIADQPASLFEYAYEVTSMGKEVAWIDGLSSYPIRLLLDLAILDERDAQQRAAPGEMRIETDWLRRCGTLDRARKHALARRDFSTVGLCDFVQARRGEGLLNTIMTWMERDQDRQRAMVNNWQDAPHRDVTLTTVRRAKGHEFPRVVIGDDLVTDRLIAQWTIDFSTRRDLNRLYTALSRAQFDIAIPQTLLGHLADHGRVVAENSRPVDSPLPESGPLHPYFGAHRHTVLEMAPGFRHRRPTASRVAQKPHHRTSGQDEIRRKMEEGARASGASSLETLRSALKGKGL